MADEDKVNLWLQKNKIYNFEGDPGLQRFELLLKTIGYSGHSFAYGDPIQQFLSANPGAVEALLEWLKVEVPANEEWAEAISNELDLDPEDEEEMSASCDLGHHARCENDGCACSCHHQPLEG